LSASITPKSASSKILILATVLSGGDWWETNGNIYKVIRDSTDLAISSGGTANTSFVSLGYGPAPNDTRNFIRTDSLNVLDSPATTSSVTYKLAFAIQRAGGTNYINRNWNGLVGGSSSLTLMEVAA
jgi:hypothetical protein